MSLFYYIFIFLLGLIAGSFLNCVIYRLENNRGFLTGRSFCPKCKHVLAWYDLIPVFSFLALMGRCRYCRKKISWQYPLVELVTGFLFVLYFWILLARRSLGGGGDLGIDLVFRFLILPFLVVIFVYDLKHYLIPDKIIYPATVLALILGFTKSPLILGDFVNPLISAIGAAAFFGAIVLVSRGKWMGVGDIKLAFFMGLVLGWPNILVALFFAFFAGAIIGLGLVSVKRKSFKSEVPFGPFLVSGTLAAMFYGQGLINWYLSLF